MYSSFSTVNLFFVCSTCPNLFCTASVVVAYGSGSFRNRQWLYFLQGIPKLLLNHWPLAHGPLIERCFYFILFIHALNLQIYAHCCFHSEPYFLRQYLVRVLISWFEVASPAKTGQKPGISWCCWRQTLTHLRVDTGTFVLSFIAPDIIINFYLYWLMVVLLRWSISNHLVVGSWSPEC